MLDEAKVEEYQKTIEVMPHIKDIEYQWKFRSSHNLVDKYFSLFPVRTKYFLLIDSFDLKTDPDLDEKLRMLDWNNKRICSIDCITLQQLSILNKTGQTI